MDNAGGVLCVCVCVCVCMGCGMASDKAVAAAVNVITWLASVFGVIGISLWPAPVTVVPPPVWLPPLERLQLMTWFTA